MAAKATEKKKEDSKKNAWLTYSDATKKKLEKLCTDYKAFISESKTERECVKNAIKILEASGYVDLKTCIAKNKKPAKQII